MLTKKSVSFCLPLPLLLHLARMEMPLCLLGLYLRLINNIILATPVAGMLSSRKQNEDMEDEPAQLPLVSELVEVYDHVNFNVLADKLTAVAFDRAGDLESADTPSSSAANTLASAVNRPTPVPSSLLLENPSCMLPKFHCKIPYPICTYSVMRISRAVDLLTFDLDP